MTVEHDPISSAREAHSAPRRRVTLSVNGANYTRDLEPRRTLLDTLRNDLSLTGAKVGCDMGQCGACTVLVDDEAMYSCLLLIYGLDAVTTILFRLIRKENIFEAHRSHFYQFLANEKGWPHLKVAALYAILQLIINGWIILFFKSADSANSLYNLLIVVIIGGTGFILLRLTIEGRKRRIKTE